MFKFEEMISNEEKMVATGLSKGFTARNFSKTDLMKARRLAHAGIDHKGVNGKNKNDFDREGKWFKKVEKEYQKAQELKNKKKKVS